ncbi:MAG: hypothetical protein NZO58_05785 [Gemmataceae bacterium]|nr:hypothetical protein [Gemmataceae bacterium]
MVATFCLRLAFGMMAPLLLLDARPIPPRFFRVQCLAALGLTIVALLFADSPAAGGTDWSAVFGAAAVVLCALGSILWHVDEAPGGGIINALAALLLGGALALSTTANETLSGAWRLADQFASAAMVGLATTAMLLGHAYLISPNMTIVPLQRLLLALGAALAARLGLALAGLWSWTAAHPLASVDAETLLWLAARWLLGIMAPLGLGWMAWETTRIRSTQSATGILYVVVIVVYLGELTSLLLLDKTGVVL